MVEADNLQRKIDDLKNWQTLAWHRIADPEVTNFERREIRNHLKDSDVELKRCLNMMSERLRFQARSVGKVGNALAEIKFRLFAGH